MLSSLADNFFLLDIEAEYNQQSRILFLFYFQLQTFFLQHQQIRYLYLLTLHSILYVKQNYNKVTYLKNAPTETWAFSSHLFGWVSMQLSTF